MLATLVSAALTCIGALLVGQLVLRLCGASAWSWTAPAVGLAAMMVVAVAALRLPGGAVSAAVVLLVLVLIGLVSVVRKPDQRPPWRGLLAGLGVLVAALVPFLSAGEVGTLGVSFNNDMSIHLLWATSLRDGVTGNLPGSYPLGPHSLVAAISGGFGFLIDYVFTGLSIAVPVILGWTALAALSARSFFRSTALALLVSMPYFVAAYYGQGAFKEVMQALFAFAVVVLLTTPLSKSIWRWVPLLLLLAGSLSVYSAQGVVWAVPVIAAWLIGMLGADLYERGSPRHALGVIKENLIPLLASIAIPLLLLITQIPRLIKFFEAAVGTATGTGIEVGNLGNLAGRVPLWPAFGVWDNPDFRGAPFDPSVNGMWTAFVLGLAIVGAVWCFKRGKWIIPVSAVIFFLIWVYADRTQSPYVAAKAIVILSPVLLLLAALPVLDVDSERFRSPRWWHFLAPLLAVILVVKVGQSSWHALRTSRVGPVAHASELRQLRPLLGSQPTLFLGNDDFVLAELSGVALGAPVVGFQTLPLRPEKPWVTGVPLDFDSIPAENYNSYNWVITPRDAAGSYPPAGLKLVRQTETFDLYKRVGTVAPRQVLAEDAQAGAVLDCTSPAGRSLLRAGGVALVRQPPVSAPLPQVAPGGVSAAALRLTPGVWDLAMPYLSPRPLEVRVAGKRFEVPASLDRPGPRLPVGAITVSETGRVGVSVRVITNTFTPRSAIATPTAIVATKRGTARLVPIRKACGRYVDWFR